METGPVKNTERTPFPTLYRYILHILQNQMLYHQLKYIQVLSYVTEIICNLFYILHIIYIYLTYTLKMTCKIYSKLDMKSNLNCFKNYLNLFFFLHLLVRRV
jgi:hypothetical protein